MENQALRDASFMLRALALARRGAGSVVPNPAVGAVVVKENQIIGWGFHRKAGEAHAEIEALRMAGGQTFGATLYLTLAPCNHYGRTPPCTEAVRNAGIARVVAAMNDPNPQVKGDGLEVLRAAGVEITVGILHEAAYELNAGWCHWVRTGRPFVRLKLAISLDGKIATASGDSHWITSPTARAHVQRLRSGVDAILVGSGTVLRDNPALTNRTGRGARPLRIVVDSELRIGREAQIYQPEQSRGVVPALVVTTTRAPFERRRELEQAGIEVVVWEDDHGRVDLRALFSFLGGRRIQTLLCEGGGELATTLIRENLCHRLHLYQAPLILGSDAQAFYCSAGGRSLEEVQRFKLLRVRRIGTDVLAEYRFPGEVPC